MQLLFVALLLSFFIAVILTPLTIRYAKRIGLVDDPKAHNHPAIIHTGLIPRSGGIPIFAALVITYLLSGQSITKQSMGIFLGALCIVVMGVLDDKYDLSPYIRFIMNIVVALIVVGFGIGINFITNPFGGVIPLTDLRLSFDIFGDTRTIVLLADAVAILWIVWMMNAINWSSGVDGQVSGIVAIGAIILGIAAWRFAATDPSQLPVVFLALVTAGAYLGFLPWSFYPQKIMPGYSGAALGGYLLAILAILSGARVATALIVLGVPMADGIWAVTRRLLRKQSPFRGDNEHFHHWLLRLGISKRNVALCYWAACAMLGIVALQLNSQGKLFALLFIAIVFGGIVYWLRHFSISLKPHDPDNG